MSYLGFGLADPSLCSKGCDQLRSEIGGGGVLAPLTLLAAPLMWSKECLERWNTQCSDYFREKESTVEAPELTLTVPKKTTSTATTATTVAPSAGAPVLLMAAVAVGVWLMFK